MRAAVASALVESRGAYTLPGKMKCNSTSALLGAIGATLALGSCAETSRVSLQASKRDGSQEFAELSVQFVDEDTGSWVSCRWRLMDASGRVAEEGVGSAVRRTLPFGQWTIEAVPLGSGDLDSRVSQTIELISGSRVEEEIRVSGVGGDGI